MNLGFILTRSPDESETDSLLLNVASKSLEKGDRVTIFLLGDSVWLAHRSRNKVENIMGKGARVVVSGEHLQACGMPRDQIAPTAEVAADTYGSLVELVMEKFDKVVMI